MDEAKFLATQERQAVKFFPLMLPGFDEPVWLRPMTTGDVKEQMLSTLNPDQPKTAVERLAKDQYYIEREIAKLMYDEKHVLIFDHNDDAKMAKLKRIVDASPHNFTTLIHDARNKLTEPDKTEVDPTGN